jgi:hypothetical protein
MGFAFRVAPGLRVAMTPRGIRAGIGPRVARMHIGAGPVGVSTGVGPFTTWTTLDRLTGRSGSSSPSSSAVRRTEEFAAAQAEHDALLTIHREQFAPASRPIVPEPQPADPSVRARRIDARYAKEREGIRWWRRADRRAAKERATVAVDAELAAELEWARREHTFAQQEADAWWAALTGGDPTVILDALNDALSDNDEEAACVAVSDDGATASLVMGTPPMSDVPERYAALTPTGRPTTREHTKTQRNALHVHLICAHLAITLKETFAVAPTVRHARVVVATPTESGPGILLAGEFDRAVLDHLDDADAPINLLELGRDVVLNTFGRTRELRPIDLAEESDLADLAAMIVDVDLD